MTRLSWVLLGWLALLPATYAVSFDCTKAATSVEKMICRDPKLSQLDDDLAAAYQKALDSNPDKQTLIQSQRNWIERRRDTCTEMRCLEITYIIRIRKLQTEQVRPPTSEADAKLRKFLTVHLRENPGRYWATSQSLDGDATPEIFVYMYDGCGNGGCDLMLLKSMGDSFKIIDNFTITRLPAYVLPTRTNGWNDIAVTIGGGGARYGTVILRFNGKKYPSNPSLAPYFAMDRNQVGVIRLPLGE